MAGAVRSAVAGAAILLSTLAPAGDFWIPFVLNGEGGDYRLESRSRESFAITGRRLSRASGRETGCIAIGTYNERHWTSKRLAVSVRSTNGRKVGVTISLVFRDGTNTFVRSLPTFDVSGKGWRELSWSLDHDMNLGDRGVEVYQAKIIAWITGWKEGEEGGVEVKTFRICNAADTAQSELWLPGDRFVNVPSAPRPKPVADAGALRVFFAFDNEDLEPLPIKGWQGEFDLPQCGGFREVMLEGAEGRAVVTADLAAADVIVYSRARPDAALAANIVRRVRAGVPLHAAGEVRDPEIEAVLPVKVSHDVLGDLPPRERIVPAPRPDRAQRRDVRHLPRMRGEAGRAYAAALRRRNARRRRGNVRPGQGRLQHGDGRLVARSGQGGDGRLLPAGARPSDGARTARTRPREDRGRRRRLAPGRGQG